ncbi:MAG: glycosyltransferase [Clostridia bacterium]|nr:glycosyltransferase [Clostridia bacterium]
MEKKVTVIIPARNERKTIKYVIDIAMKNQSTDEVIVVNNNSTDSTAKVAEKHGARVVDCEEVGKGNAMAKGLLEAKNDIVVFLDADILNYNESIVDTLSSPIINGEADFVKSTFDRTTGGTVTKIVVQPLLNILYPDLYKFQEPISGMIACKKSILEKIKFESDYGVDIAIVLDLYNMGVKMKETNIGEILNMSHKNKTTETMAKMSYEIMKAIIKKAKEHGVY